ncbi:MAG: protein kinase [Proteobacteria bacterium]|nr:protein kinase [Pseudomonadota bacterium]
MSNQKCRLCLKVNPPGSRFCNFCGNDLTFSIQPDGLLPAGAILRGSYVVENVIGEGGMGVVYSCHHKTLGTRYALKVLDPKLARIEILRQRFLAEAKIQATVRHPHIVHVLDVIDSDKEGGIPGVLAIVMEFIEGEPLDQRIEENQLSERDAVSTALVVLDAIGFAHHASIVHRDLKPSNIMISAAESKDALYRGVKVMDFGIAKLLQDNEQRTVTGAQMGTPQYMAPEQIENARDVDERTDLYAIGLTLYEMLCGRKPFQDYREFELIKAQLSIKPPSMRTYRSDISDRLEAIVMKSLEKNRANRYPNAESFQRALLSLGGYDDIPLMLNPYDGTSVVQTNQKLQRKIERAIAKSNEAGNSEGKSEKSKIAAKPARQVVKEISISSEAKNAKNSKLPIESKSEPKKNASSEAFAKTESAEKLPKSSPHKSIVQISKEKKQKDSDTPSKTFKRNKSSVKASIASESRASKENKAPASSQTPQPTKSEKVVSSPQAVAADIKQTEHKKTPPPSEAVEKPKKSSQHQTPVKRPVQKDQVQKKRSSKALKIVLVAILLLLIAGVIYRQHQEMPLPSPVSVQEPDSDASHTDSQVKVDDVSSLPLREIATETGRMTVIAPARHWISTEKRDELHQVELGEFAIDQVEVSYYQYSRCVDSGKCPPVANIPDDINEPVTGIGYGSAEAFCQFAGKTLPSEEQWEAAARFGGENNGITYVNVSCENIHFGASSHGECKGKSPKGPESVFARTQSGNPGHILNMLGNVREWTSTADKKSPQKYITKGGSWQSDRQDINISGRVLASANTGEEDLGFRCILTK